MRSLPTEKCIRSLFAAEGYLELKLPHRALGVLDRIEEAGELEPYSLYLRGQALQQLNRYEEAIDALHKAARTLPAPFDRKVWADLSDCFRHQGLEELADVAELFSEDPAGGSDIQLSETLSLRDWDGGWSLVPNQRTDPWNRTGFDDFEQYNFDDFGLGADRRFKTTSHKPPQK